MAAELDLTGDGVPDDAAAFLGRLLDPHGQRTAPSGLTGPAPTPSYPAREGWADPIRQFGLHASPERLDDGVVVGNPDGAERGQQAGLAGALYAVIAVNSAR